MEIILEDIKRTLGAKRIYLPGSAEQALHLVRKCGDCEPALKNSKNKVEELENAIECLGIVDSAVDMGQALRANDRVSRSRLGRESQTIGATGESDKENMHVGGSRFDRRKESGRLGVGMVGVD